MKALVVNMFMVPHHNAIECNPFTNFFMFHYVTTFMVQHHNALDVFTFIYMTWLISLQISFFHKLLGFSIIILTFVCHLIGLILFNKLQYVISSSDFINFWLEDLGLSSSSVEESLLLLISFNFLSSWRTDTRS